MNNEISKNQGVTALTEKPNKTVFAAVIASLATAIIVGGIVYMWQRTQMQQLASEIESLEQELVLVGLEEADDAVATESSTTPTPLNPSPTPRPTSPVALVESTNPKEGYSFKYPATWKISTTSSETSFDTTSGEFVNVRSQENPKNLSVPNWISENFSADHAANFVPVTYNGNVGYELTNGGVWYFKLTSGDILTIIFQTYSGPGSERGIKDEVEFKQMLNSLKIL